MRRRAGIARGAAFAGLAAAAALTASPPADLGVLRSDAPGSGFAQALGPVALEFPREHAAHPEFRQEWWYFTGNLDAADGARFGFELTFFRFALIPAGPAPAPGGSAWRAREIYMAHFALTDVTGQRFRFAQKLSRAALGLAGAADSPLKVWLDDWSLEVLPQDAPGAPWRLRAAQEGYALALDLQPLGAPVLNGEAGWSVKSDEPGAASYYYSIPRLAVRGQLVRDGEALKVAGLAWFDHEWGSGALGAHQSGWDWFALQLDDGTALMFYALRDAEGRRDPHSAGAWIDGTQRARALSSAEVAIEVTDHWKNAQGARYPSAWRIRVPALALEASVRPVLADQELKTRPQYWEGAVDVSGLRQGHPLGGRGYVELVGYAQERPGARGTGAAARLAR